MTYITGFSDEIAEDFEGQIEGFKTLGINYLDLRTAWGRNVLDLSLDVVRVESNPQLAQIVPPNEPVVLIGFQLTIGNVHGMMNLCIPHGSIQRIRRMPESDSSCHMESTW